MMSTVNTRSRRGRIVTSALAVSTVGLAGLLSGCGMAVSTVENGGSPGGAAAVQVQGRVRGGQQPVSNSTIQLYAVNLGAQKGASTPLLNQVVMTDGGGNFLITGKYTCPANSYVYMTATGGNPGLGGNTNNAGLALMTALGRCDALLTTYPFIQVNELTTVGSVYALAPFMADFGHVGAATSNTAGIVNAFANVNSLITVGFGIAPGAGLPATSTAPVNELNTLADVIAPCVNSDGTGTPCASLFAAAKNAGGTTPVDTISALLNIAANPTANVATLYGMSAANAPFQPTLAGTPADWSVAITSTGGGLAAPYAVAIDAAGTAWVANSAGTNVTKLTRTQTASSITGGGLLGPQGIAVDTAGNIWVANSYGSSLVELNNAGTILSGANGYTTGGISSPFAVAIDTANNVWIANYDTGSVSGVATGGATPVAISGSPFTAGGSVLLPVSVAIDATNNVWISSSGNDVVSEISNTGANLSGAGGFTDGVLQAPAGLVIDGNARTYVAGTGDNAVTVLAATGTPVAATPVTGGGVVLPTGVAVDGANVVFTTNSQTAGSFSRIASPTATAISIGTLNGPVGIAVDASGSVWTTNTGDNTVSQFIGLATPVRTPLVNHFLPLN